MNPFLNPVRVFRDLMICLLPLRPFKLPYRALFIVSQSGLLSRILPIMLGWFRVFYRFFYFIYATMVAIISFLWLMAIGKDKRSAGLKVRRRWLNKVPGVAGIALRLEGKPYSGPCLYVANHISYIDPIAVLSYVEAAVVAKAEVKKWPLVGLGAYIVGTIFVNRESKESRHETANTIRHALEQKESILVFPEGTTSAGPTTLPFKPRSFEAAAAANIPVQPIAIAFDAPDIAFIGKDTFIPHFFRVFRHSKITGRIYFGPLLTGEGMAEQARHWIDQVQTDYTQQRKAA